ncbi:MAG: phosphotransferase [Candidatus Bathyarchaeia archaeon]
MTGGFDTRIFRFQLNEIPSKLSCPMILRLFKNSSQHRAIFERAAQSAVVDAGYPAPKVFFTCTDDSVLGGSFIIMELIPEQTMVNMPLKRV